MFQQNIKTIWILVLLAITARPVLAHDPIFGIGPHVLFKNGVETSLEFESEKAGGDKEKIVALELTYGLTGDWALGVDLPYVFKDDAVNNSNGKDDFTIFTKYRFWRKDSLGLQESAALLIKIITDTADSNKNPILDKGTTDSILGLTYGYEGRKWYRWASARYRFNGTNNAGINRGDKILIDFVGGIRPKLTGYREIDIVWLLELNSEVGQRAEQSGVELLNTGGTEIFISPGIFWTKRNFAIKAGIQIPIYQDLNEIQNKSDYRASMTFEWHL
jgi:hypothetical protein